jgi:MFS family permease
MWVSTPNPSVRWVQLVLLLVLTAFLGAMWGLERTTVPLIAEQDFGITSTAVTLSFVAGFGVTKAFANLFAGGLMDRIGRKRVLAIGWAAGIPVPLMIIWAPSWEWIVAANLLLGVNQGLGWTATILMMMDHFGPKRGGLSTGLNELVGYSGVAALTVATGFIAATFAPRPHPFFIGIALALTGLIVTVAFVRETHHHVDAEPTLGDAPSFRQAFAEASLDRSMASLNQAGLVTKINDATVWGLLPLYLAAQGVGLVEISIVAAVYPQVWGIGQGVSGALGDRIGRKPLIVTGMLTQALGIATLAFAGGLGGWITGAALLGLGTAAVYPTLIAAVGDRAHPKRRASAIGVYRWYRDAGFVVGALIAGGLADTLGYQAAYLVIGVISLASASLVAIGLSQPAGSAEAAFETGA